MDRTQRRIIIFRDVSCIFGGLLGLAHQTVVAAEASAVLVPAFVSLILYPAGVALWAQRNGAGQNTIERSSSEPPSSQGQPPSSQQ